MSPLCIRSLAIGDKAGRDQAEAGEFPLLCSKLGAQPCIRTGVTQSFGSESVHSESRASTIEYQVPHLSICHAAHCYIRTSISKEGWKENYATMGRKRWKVLQYRAYVW